MEEFTNEFELARNYGFDITMPEGNLGLSSAAHMEYMNKCTALYKHFLSNMNSIIRMEKETKKGLSKLHREKMENLRYSLYRSANATNGNDPFEKAQENMSMSHTGLDSRVNTPWGLGAVPQEEEEKIRPHTAPAGTLKRTGSVTKRKPSSDVEDGDNDDEQVSTTGLSDPGGTTDEVLVGIIDAKTEKKIVVGQHSFAKLGNKSVNVKLKNREGIFKVKPLKLEVETDKSSSVAYDPSKPKTTYDPVNEKLAMVKKETSYMSPTIASDMKINNKLPIQKSLKGLNAKRTTVVDIYRNSRDRRTRHFRIVTRKPQQDGESGTFSSTSQRLSRLATAAKAVRLFSLRNESESVDGDYFRGRTDTMSTAGPRTPSRVAFAREDSGQVFPSQRDNPSRIALGRSDSQQSNNGILFQRDSSSRLAVGRSDSQLSNALFQLQRSDSQLSNTRSITTRDGTANANMTDRRMGKNVGAMPQTDLAESFNSSRRTSSFSAAVTASMFVNKLRKSVSPDTVKELGFVKPSMIESNTDTKKIVKQQMKKDRELDEQMTSWRRRMVIRSGTMSKSRMKPGGGRMKLI